MNLKEIQELLKQINKLELAEFKMKTEELELSVRTKHYEKSKSQVISAPIAPVQAAPVISAAPVQAPAAPQPAAPQSTPDLPPLQQSSPAAGTQLLEIKSPIVGTFYRSSAPDKPVFLKVGDTVAQGDVVCIVEAMKLFNEIESEVSGKVVEVMVEDASPVEYDQVLFLVDPNG